MNTPAQESEKKLEKQSLQEKIVTLRQLVLDLAGLFEQVIDNSPFERTETPHALNRTAKLNFEWARLNWDVLSHKKPFQAGSSYSAYQLTLRNPANKSKTQIHFTKPSFQDTELDIHVNQTHLIELFLPQQIKENPSPETYCHIDDAIIALRKISNMLKSYIAVSKESAEEKKLKRINSNSNKIRQEALDLLRSL